MRAFAAVPIAIAVCVATPAFADASSHITGAKKAERKGDWRKALQEWKAAYAAEPNAEYLIGIGDAYSQPRQQGRGEEELRGLPRRPAGAAGERREGEGEDSRRWDRRPEELSRARPPPLSVSEAPRPPERPHRRGGLAAPPVLDLPAAVPPPTMPPLPVWSCRVRPLPRRRGRKRSRPAARRRSRFLALRRRSEPAAAPKKDAFQAVADGAKAPAKPIAMVPAARGQSSDKAPVAALTATAMPQDSRRGSSGGIPADHGIRDRGVAVPPLGGGALAFTKANSAQNDLTGGVHSGSDAQRPAG